MMNRDRITMSEIDEMVELLLRHHAAERRRCIDVARECNNYNGGHSGEKLEAFHHGINTVVRNLEALK